MVGKTRRVMSVSFVTGAHNPDTATAIGGDEFFAPTKLHRHPEARARSASLERWKQARCMNIGKSNSLFHIPSYYVVEDAITQRKPPEVRIWTLRNQSRVGTCPPSTSTPHYPACWGCVRDACNFSLLGQ